MGISRQMQKYLAGGSLIRRLFEEGVAMQNDGTGLPVYDFSLGNPMLPPPDAFEEALAHYVGHRPSSPHGYMANAGLPETRSAVAASLSKDHPVQFEWQHILMTVGAAGAVNVALKTLLDAGDEVLVSAPYFVEYGYYVENHGGRLVKAPTCEDFNLDVAAIENALSDKTRVVLINNPNNPTGVMYPQETLNALGNVLRKASGRYGRPIYLLDDAPYRKLVYDVPVCTSAFAAYENTLMVTSHSKDLSLPGERVGFLAVSPRAAAAELILSGCALANRILGFVNAPALMQHVAASLQDVTVDLAWYRKRRDRLFRALTSYGYRMPYPDGAFYLFVKAPGEDDTRFVAHLKKQRVLTVPGSGFGMPGYFRIAYCVNENTIEGALQIFKEAIKNIP